MVEIGEMVIYVDEKKVTHYALVTAVHGDPEDKPSINLVYVSGNPAEIDPNGRQISRQSSVVHESNQPAEGFCYRT